MLTIVPQAQAASLPQQPYGNSDLVNQPEMLTPVQKARVLKAEQALSTKHPALIVTDRIKEIGKALFDQSEPSVTWPGKIADRIYQFAGSFFKRNVQANLQEPSAPPLSPGETPSDFSPQGDTPSTDEEGFFYCSSRIFKYDLSAGTTSLQVRVPDSLDCECAAINALYQAQLKLVYISDSQPTHNREYRFTAHNITAIFTADRYLPKQLTDIIPDKMPEILDYVKNECTVDKYKDTRIILGVTLGGAGLLFIAGIALYVNRQNLKECSRNRCPA